MISNYRFTLIPEQKYLLFFLILASSTPYAESRDGEVACLAILRSVILREACLRLLPEISNKLWETYNLSLAKQIEPYCFDPSVPIEKKQKFLAPFLEGIQNVSQEKAQMLCIDEYEFDLSNTDLEYRPQMLEFLSRHGKEKKELP